MARKQEMQTESATPTDAATTSAMSGSSELRVKLRPIFDKFDIDGSGAVSTDELAATAADYAHERWAAGRAVCPELWRLMAGCTDERVLGALIRAAGDADPLTREAARMALRESSETIEEAATALSQWPEWTPLYESWDALGVAYEVTKDSIGKLQVLYPAPAKNLQKGQA